MDALIVRRSVPTVDTEAWVRNPTWPAADADPGDDKIVGLYAVWPGDGSGAGGNFFAMTISGAYTINFGDGTTTNFTSGSTAYREYDYNDADLNNTDGPVTFTASTDTVNRTAHGYVNGNIVSFYNIVTTTGISEGQQYYVIDAAADSFKISETLGGSAVTLTNDGSATLLPYKIATVTITPQGGASLTNVNFFVKHNQSGLANGYSTGWLDITVACSTITTLTIGSSAGDVYHSYLERVRLKELGSVTTFASLFRNMVSLERVEIASSITTVTNANNMYNASYSLKEVPLWDTSSVTDMNNMHRDCRNLTSAPAYDTSSVTNNMNSMFFNCMGLRTVPLYDTSGVTNMASMFQGCFSLLYVPLFDMTSNTTTTSMFSGCTSLRSVPLFNMSSVTTANTMFSSCFSLESIPDFDTSAITNAQTMFGGCRSLNRIPALDFSAVTSSTNFNNIFLSCGNLARVEATGFGYSFSVLNCKLSSAALDEIYTNLPSVTATITVTGNYGTAGDDPTIATNKGWTVTG